MDAVWKDKREGWSSYVDLLENYLRYANVHNCAPGCRQGCGYVDHWGLVIEPKNHFSHACRRLDTWKILS